MQLNVFRIFKFFLQIEFETFVKAKSAAELGTSAASINRTGKTNAKKGVHSNYNEYKEFHEREVEAHICAAFMEMSSMYKVDGMQHFEYFKNVRNVSMPEIPIGPPSYRRLWKTAKARKYHINADLLFNVLREGEVKESNQYNFLGGVGCYFLEEHKLQAKLLLI